MADDNGADEAVKALNGQVVDGQEIKVEQTALAAAKSAFRQ